MMSSYWSDSAHHDASAVTQKKQLLKLLKNFAKKILQGHKIRYCYLLIKEKSVQKMLSLLKDQELKR